MLTFEKYLWKLLWSIWFISNFINTHNNTSFLHFGSMIITTTTKKSTNNLPMSQFNILHTIKSYSVITYRSEARRWHIGGRQLNYLLSLPSCLTATAIIYLWCLYPLFSQENHAKFYTPVCFATLHTILNLQLLCSVNFKACGTSINLAELYFFILMVVRLYLLGFR